MTPAALIGKWKVQELSLPSPDKCRDIYLNINSDGSLLSTDGTLEETMRWAASPHAMGFLITYTYISNNGKVNCQGIPAETVRENTLKVSYVEIEDGGRSLRFYLGSERTDHYMLFKK